MSKDKRVSVIIVSHNNKDILPSNLKSLKEQTFKDFKIFIIDNDSTDGSKEFIEKYYPYVTFIDISAGVDKKRNIGIAQSNSEYILTLDSDVNISREALQKAVEYMDNHKDVGICCGKMINKEGLIDYAGSLCARNGGGSDIGHGKKDSYEYNTFKRISGMTTAFAILRRRMIKEIGTFDEKYYYGYEDQDIGLRANFAGWKVMYNPDLLAIHGYHSTLSKLRKKSNDNMDFHIKKNRILTLLKNFDFRTLIIDSPLILTSLLFDLTKKDRTSSLKAYIWILRNFKEILKIRKENLLHKKVKDEELFKEIYFPLKTKGYFRQNRIISFIKRIKEKNLRNLTFFITTKCNSRCKHCFYWKSLNEKKDLTLEEIEKIISKFNRIYSVSLSGGEPFIREDLEDIIKLIVKYTGAKVIDIPTNCLTNVKGRFEKILQNNPQTNFSIVCSLDGMKKEHDFIRGVNGGFEKTLKMISDFANLKKKYINFKALTVNTVVTNQNYETLPKFIEFVKTLPVTGHVFDIIRGEHQKILRPPTIEQIKKFNKLKIKTLRYYNKKRKFSEKIFYNLKDKEIAKIQLGVFKNKKWPFYCTAGKTDLVVESNGDLKICELQPKVGSLFQNSPEELLKCEEAKKIFNQINKHQCDCTHICNLYSSADHSFKNLIFDRVF